MHFDACLLSLFLGDTMAFLFFRTRAAFKKEKPTHSECHFGSYVFFPL